MTTLVSTTTGAARSSRQLRQTIRVVPIDVGSIEDAAQLDAIEVQQSRELPFAQQLPTLGLGGEEAEAKGHWSLRATAIRVDDTRLAQNLTCLFVGDSAVCLEPVPRTLLDEAELLQPADHRFTGHAECVRQEDDVASREAGCTRGEVLKPDRDGSRRREECTSEHVGVPFLAGIVVLIEPANVGRLPARRQMPEFVHAGLCLAFAGVVGVQQAPTPSSYANSPETRLSSGRT